MNIKNFSKHIFWSYNKNADLPEETIIWQVLLYGEIKDMVLLVKQIDKEVIIQVMKKISFLGRYNRRLNFIKKVIL
ncbi:MAG: hypothetical protein KAW56_03825 [Candidatus Marinimicrobia bacterium]|nr:hypothetical protein [Candidatus Neomarinimicrobiota bacterium]